VKVGDLVTIRIRGESKPPTPVPGIILSRKIDKFGKLEFEVLVEGETITTTILDLGPIDLIKDKTRLTKKWIDLYKKNKP
jgi:hypothetical protein